MFGASGLSGAHLNSDLEASADVSNGEVLHRFGDVICCEASQWRCLLECKEGLTENTFCDSWDSSLMQSLPLGREIQAASEEPADGVRFSQCVLASQRWVWF